MLLAPLLMIAAQARAAPAPSLPAPPVQAQPAAVWDPVAPYITVGQDEPGYRYWYAGASWRRDYVRAFHDYLSQYGVGEVVPTWQLLRTATSWHRCGGQPFEVPPVHEWPHIVQTLRYIQAHVVPAIGPVEAVSGYRNPHLNVCAGGAPESAHKSYSAIDMVPLRPITREALMRTLCGVHARNGANYGAGLGFYAYLRFHVDTTKFRRWGAVSSDCPAIVRPEDMASVAQPLTPAPVGAAASAVAQSPIAADPTPASPVPVIEQTPSPDPAAKQVPQPQQ
jgi:hypothetical protein